MKQSSVVLSDPDIMGGTTVFVETRVAVQALIDYIEGGHSLEKFLDHFPTVSRNIAVAALEQPTIARNASAGRLSGQFITYGQFHSSLGWTSSERARTAREARLKARCDARCSP